MATDNDQNVLLESLKLIIQSQMVLDDLQRNQKKLEDLIRTLTHDAPVEESKND